MTRRYAQFDPTEIGALLALERGNTVLTYAAPCDINRCCLMTWPHTAGRHNAEFIAWGDASIANAVSIGIARPTHPTNTYPGGHADGYGYRPAEGAIYNAGSSIASVAVGAKGQVVSVFADLSDPLNPWVRWSLDGVPLHVEVLPDDGPWLLAVTVSGSTGYDLRLLAHTGQRGKFEFVEPAAPYGWFGAREAIGVIRLADFPFIAPGSSSTPHARYRGLLREDSRLSLRRSVMPWMLREAGSAGSLSAASGSLRVENADGAFDVLKSMDATGAAVRIRYVPDGGDIDSAIPVALLRVADIQSDGDGSLDIVLDDPVSALSQPLVRRLARPDADPTAADRPLPISLGAARSVEPMLLDADSRTYALHDGPISGVGAVRDGGKQLDPNDYSIDADGRIILDADPERALTADIQVSGSAYVPPAEVDVLNGDGNPFAGSPPGDPTNWAHTAFDGRAPDFYDVERTGTRSVRFRQDYQIESYLTHSSVVLTAGMRYRITLTIESMQPFDENAGVASLWFCEGPYFGGRSVPLAQSAHDPAIVMGPGGVPMTLPATITVETAARWAHGVTLGYYGNNVVDSSTGATPPDTIWCQIRDLTVIELPTAQYVEDDDAVPLLLADAMEELLQANAGWLPSDWDRAGAEAIDTATGFAGIDMHVSSGESASNAACITSVLDAYSAGAYRDSAGILRFLTLTPPELGVPEGVLTVAKALQAPRTWRAKAPGLTTQAMARKNWTVLDEGRMNPSTSDVPLDVRARLSAGYRIGVASGFTPSTAYADAIGAEPVGTLLDKRADAQRMIDDAVAFFSTARWWAEWVVPWRPDYEIGQIYVSDYVDADGKRRDFPSPKPMVVLDIDPDPIRETVTLLMLG